MEQPTIEQHKIMDQVLQANGEIIGQVFDNIFSREDLEFSQQLILSFNTFSSAIEAFADSIQSAGVAGWNFEKMMIGINRSYKINKEERTKEKIEEMPLIGENNDK